MVSSKPDPMRALFEVFHLRFKIISERERLEHLYQWISRCVDQKDIHNICLDCLGSNGFLYSYGIDYENCPLEERQKVLKEKLDPCLRTFYEQVYDDYLSQKLRGTFWRVFSDKRAPCLKGESADIAFQRQSRGHVIVIGAREGDAYIVENGEAFTPGIVREFYEVILLDQSYKWCYIKPHEQDIPNFFSVMG